MKKLLIILISFILLGLSIPSFSVFAENKECTITIGKANANPGDEEIYIPVRIDNNPGISAVTVAFTYDSSVLEYKKFKQGRAFTDGIMLKEHPNKNLIKIALVEKYDDSTNNEEILTMIFKVKEKANTDFYEIGLKYSSGDIVNKKLASIMPKIISGGVDVAYNPELKNCAHKKFGDWSVVAQATCTEEGIKQRECIVCGHKETDSVPPAGHEYEDVWTIDTPASSTQDGVMTRHCKFCTSTTDRITFPFKDVDKEDINNESGAEVPNNDYTEDLFEEQHPEINSQNSSSKKPTVSTPDKTKPDVTSPNNTTNTTTSKTENTHNNISQNSDKNSSQTDNITSVDNNINKVEGNNKTENIESSINNKNPNGNNKTENVDKSNNSESSLVNSNESILSNSTNEVTSSSVLSDNSTQTEDFSSTASYTFVGSTLRTHKTIFIIIGAILLVILLAIIAIVACQKPKF